MIYFTNYFKGVTGFLTQKSNGDGVPVETVLVPFCNDSQVEVCIVLVDVLDHEGTVPFVLVSDDFGFAPVSLQHPSVICVINKCVLVMVVDGKLTSLPSFPVNLNIVGVELVRVGENTRYGHVWSGQRKNGTRDINAPTLTCVWNQPRFYIIRGYATLDPVHHMCRRHLLTQRPGGVWDLAPHGRTASSGPNKQYGG